jgi:hypothetical protein
MTEPTLLGEGRNGGAKAKAPHGSLHKTEDVALVSCLNEFGPDAEGVCFKTNLLGDFFGGGAWGRRDLLRIKQSILANVHELHGDLRSGHFHRI